jgi:putative membrane protein
MDIASGPFIIILSFYFLYEIITFQKEKTKNLKKSFVYNISKRWILYFCTIILCSYFLEFAGVKTGYIFGRFKYSGILIPEFFGIPAAIGFAWFGISIMSLGMIRKFTKINLDLFKPLTKSLIIGFLMMVFDVFMEPAAIALNYWKWDIGIVYTQNYIVWFVCGTLFSLLGFKLDIFRLKLPPIIYHGYFVFIIFFVLTYFK